MVQLHRASENLFVRPLLESNRFTFNREPETVKERELWMYIIHKYIYREYSSSKEKQNSIEL